MASQSSTHSYTCTVCKRSFAQESTKKRHYYYCRSKAPTANASRKKSCAACIRAKTRCAWSNEGNLEKCIRCNARSVDCEYEPSSRRPQRTEKGSNTTLSNPKPQEIQDETSYSAEDLDLSAPTEEDESIDTPLDYSQHKQRTHTIGEIDSLAFQYTMMQNGDIHIGDDIYLDQEDLVDGKPSLAKLSKKTINRNLFSPIAFTKPGHASIVTVATRILRSYPFMMLQNRTLPPFIHPSILSETYAPKGSQQALINCASLVQMFKTRTEANKEFIWKMIGLEQERILDEHLKFGKWELLASLQSLLIYCLLRLHDTPAEHGISDVSLLVTSNLVANALISASGNRCYSTLSGDDEVSWKRWMFYESSNRTTLAFQILGTLFDISTTVSYCGVLGFSLIPLATDASMWNAQNVEEWGPEFKSFAKGIVYGVSDNGELTRIEELNAGTVVSSTAADWEDWSARVGDMGILVMIVASLL